MIKSQSTKNRSFNCNSKSVLDLDIITLYFGHSTKCPRKQLYVTHGVSITKLWYSEIMKICHHLKHPYVSKHNKVEVLQIIVICNNSLKIKKFKNCPLKGVHEKLIFWVKCLKMKCSYNYPWWKSIVGFSKKKIQYLKWIFLIQKHKGLISSKTSCVLTFKRN